MDFIQLPSKRIIETRHRLNMTKLVVFKAGKVDIDKDARLAVAQAQTGTVTVSRGEGEPMVEFSWKPRPISAVAAPATASREEADEPLLLFPGDAKWFHLEQCRTGRVFCLQFLSSGQKHLFWMQSAPDDDNLGALTESDLSVQKTLQELLEEPADHMEVESNEPLESTSVEPAQQTQLTSPFIPQAPIQSLLDAVSVSDMTAYILSLPESQLESFYEHIPSPLEKNRTELIRVIQSPQFAQSANLLSNALVQGSAGHIVASQLGFPYQGEGIEGFLRGIKRQSPGAE